MNVRNVLTLSAVEREAFNSVMARAEKARSDAEAIARAIIAEHGGPPLAGGGSFSSVAGGETMSYDAEAAEVAPSRPRLVKVEAESAGTADTEG